MPLESREERRLMRMRGAGVKELQNPCFNFVFGTSSSESSLVASELGLATGTQDCSGGSPASPQVHSNTAVPGVSATAAECASSQSRQKRSALSSDTTHVPRKRGRPQAAAVAVLEDTHDEKHALGQQQSMLLIARKTKRVKRLQVENQDSNSSHIITSAGLKEADARLTTSNRRQPCKKVKANVSPWHIDKENHVPISTAPNKPQKSVRKAKRQTAQSTPPNKKLAKGKTPARTTDRVRLEKHKEKPKDQTLNNIPSSQQGEKLVSRPSLDRHKCAPGQQKLPGTNSSVGPITIEPTTLSASDMREPYNHHQFLDDTLLEQALRKMVAKYFRQGNFEHLTVSHVRTAVETRLSLPANFFKLHDTWSSKSKLVIRDQVKYQQTTEKTVNQDPHVSYNQVTEDVSAEMVVPDDVDTMKHETKIEQAASDNSAIRLPELTAPSKAQSIFPIPNLAPPSAQSKYSKSTHFPLEPSASDSKSAAAQKKVSQRQIVAGDSSQPVSRSKIAQTKPRPQSINEKATAYNQTRKASRTIRHVPDSDDDLSVLENNGYMDHFPMPKVPASLAVSTQSMSRFRFRI